MYGPLGQNASAANQNGKCWMSRQKKNELKTEEQAGEALKSSMSKLCEMLTLPLTREHCVVPGEPVVNDLTENGENLIAECSRIGMSVADIASMLRKPESWLRDRMKERASLAMLIDSSVALGKAELLASQHDMAHYNAQMSIHLGKVRLDQKDKDDNRVVHEHWVVGAIPQFQAKSEDWLKKFAPPAPDAPVTPQLTTTAVTSASPTDLRPSPLRMPVVVDAEIDEEQSL